MLLKKMILSFFIQRLRDEAHRFAISTHRAKEKEKFEVNRS
jgi:excinuclease UvrABC nuclease subunit